MLSRVSRPPSPASFSRYTAPGAMRLAGGDADALRLVFRYAKPMDAVVIGMFPKYKEQVKENCRLFREALKPPATT